MGGALREDPVDSRSAGIATRGDLEPKGGEAGLGLVEVIWWGFGRGFCSNSSLTSTAVGIGGAVLGWNFRKKDQGFVRMGSGVSLLVLETSGFLLAKLVLETGSVSVLLSHNETNVPVDRSS